ncbi:MAG: DUF402 domain-containing protein [Desulfobacteraceae bacterium]|nr:DUF402 domain-containing protein [Desulfobacteraceae bacterium]
MSTRIKIRSIYSTALTKLVLDAGYTVVEPSARIRERFSMEPVDESFEILVQDRQDLQGIELLGPPEKVCQFLTFIQERLLDATLVESDAAESNDALVTALVEFPGESKRVLDELRLSVMPTVSAHHRLRIIDSKALENAEIYLKNHPDKKLDIERQLFAGTILHPLEKQGTVKLEHMRPSGKAMRPREGILVAMDDSRIAFKRAFYHGRYDGLDLPIQQGDYCITEVQEGLWYIKHSYFSKGGKLIGEYYNVNTPVELYPFGARYLDLEIDVVRRAGEPPQVIDREKLALLARRGNIGRSLEAKTIEVAEDLMRRVKGTER